MSASSESRVYKTLIVIDEEPGRHVADTISYEEKLWLVPYWLSEPAEKWRAPKRIVYPGHQKFERAKPEDGADWVLSGTVPKAALENRAALEPNRGYEIRENPPLKFPIE